MLNVLRLLCILLIVSAVYADDETTIPPADEWYRADYAPLYGDKPWEKAAELAEHFAATVQIHGESAETVDSLPWITDALQEWKIEGWIRSEIAEMEFDLLNPTTAAFKTKWRDYYNAGNVGYDCTWYLAGFIDGAWKITDVAGIDCAEHSL